MENNKFYRNTLIAIAVGIWFIVLQNAGIFPQLRATAVKSDSPLEVKGIVEVENVVLVKGKVDANLESINGYAKFYKDPRTGQYYVLPVTDPYE